MLAQTLTIANTVASAAEYRIVSRFALAICVIRRSLMLWTITIILVILWAVGFVGFHVVGWWIHLLLVLALIVLIFNLIGGRRGI